MNNKKRKINDGYDDEYKDDNNIIFRNHIFNHRLLKNTYIHEETYVGSVQNDCIDYSIPNICFHENQKCGICIHGKDKSYCKECGGSQICIHGKNKKNCKECGGLNICIHGKIKSYCKECGGSQICIHGKRKSNCKECGGSNICIHNKQKQKCKECGGSQICIHNKNKECSNSK